MSSQPDSPPQDGIEPANGIGGLRKRKERAKDRGAPPPRHPRRQQETVIETPAPQGEVASSAAAPLEISHEVAREIPARDVAALGEQETVQASSASAASSGVAQEVSAEAVKAEVAKAEAPPASTVAEPAEPVTVATTGLPLPNLEVDLTDPAAMMVTPTVMSIPGPIMQRFDVARASAPSHTALVLNALRAHAQQLPDLVLARRPGPRPGDLFPYRGEPGSGSPVRPAPLRVRPTAGELAIMDALSAWVNKEISRRRPGGRRVSRSEVVAVALDAYLPQPRKRNTA